MRIKDLTVQAAVLNRHQLAGGTRRVSHYRCSGQDRRLRTLRKYWWIAEGEARLAKRKRAATSITRTHLERSGGFALAHGAHEVVKRVLLTRKLRPKAKLVDCVAHVEVRVGVHLRIVRLSGPQRACVTRQHVPGAACTGSVR